MGLKRIEHSPLSQVRFEALSFERQKRATHAHSPVSLGDKENYVYECIDFDFPIDSVIQVKGGRGAGVSILLRLLGGILPPTSGKYIFNGIDVYSQTLREFQKEQLAIGYGFDYAGLISNRTLLENLTLPLLYHKKLNWQEAQEHAAWYVDRFRMEDEQHSRPAHASWAARKLCILSRALMLCPTMLLLDNPTNGLNREGVMMLVEVIEHHRVHHNLKSIFFGTEDEYLLAHFDYETLMIKESKLLLTSNKGFRRSEIKDAS